MKRKAIYTLPLLAALVTLAGYCNSALAAIQDIDIADYTALPPFIDLAGGGGFPSFLLAMSRDNQVFFKAYSDYGDLDGDNIPETTYLPDFEYYGLFNPDLCYEYRPDAIRLDNTEGGFIPKDFSARDSSGRYNHICDGTTWSGNFMNWATAIRLDIIQKVIYGGRRIIDTDAETYLIGAWTPPDNHSFVKYLSGQSVINGATPIRDSSGAVPEQLTLCRTSMHHSSQPNAGWIHVVAGENSPPPMVRIAVGDFRQWDFQERPCFRSGPGGSEARREFDETFTFVGDFFNADNPVPAHLNPYTIQFEDIIGTARPSDFDYNPSSPSPILADLVDTSTMRQGAITSADTGTRSSPAFFRRLGFSLAVKVCDRNLQNAANKEACREYPNGNLKPSGFLQRYGEPGLMRVGLMTTSYRAALHGGILFGRLANIDRHGEQDADGNVAAPEINQQTGIFNLATRAFATASYRGIFFINNQYTFVDGVSEARAAMGDGRIISYLDSIRLVGRQYVIDDQVFQNNGSTLLDYNFARATRYLIGTRSPITPNDQCGFTGTRIEESCMNWGNPYAELISEAVRYLAGSETPTQSYLEGDWSSASELGNILGNIFNPSGVLTSQTEVGFLWGHDNTLAWSDNADLLDVDLDCSPMNILAINSSVTSEDANDLQNDQAISSTSSTTWGEGVIEQATSRIGQLEGLHGQSFILPATDDSNVCIYRQLANLADVRGLCPNAPALQGSYYSAGAAFLAHTTDLRTDLDGEQTINFLGIEMRPNVPQIIIPLSPGGSDSILLQPGYARRQLLGSNIALLNNGTAVGYNNGRLTQFQPVYEPRWTIPNCRYEGVYIIGWEDALSGTDFDVDIIGYIDFKVHIPGAGCPFKGDRTMVEVGSQMSTAGSGPFQHFMGFTIAGTTQDGFHAFAGAYSTEIGLDIERGVYNAGALSYPAPGNDTPTNFAPNQPPSCDATVSHWDPALIDVTDPEDTAMTVDLRREAGTDARNTVSGCAHHTPRVSHLFVPSGSSSPSIIRPPLFYAAKYGGFKDSNDNKLPDLESEWDALDNRTGLAGADGEPDNYFLVTDPTILDGALERALVQGGISQRTASGTAAALVANEREGLGAVFQALFEPSFEDDNNDVATWFGTLHALFIDSRGLLREDSNGNARLDDYMLDKVVEVEFNESEGDTEARIFNSSDAASFVPAGSTVKAVSELGTIWNARKWLDQASVGTQRSYSASAAGAGDRRFIQTWLDGNSNGRMEQAELVDFHQNTASLASNAGGINHFDVATADEVEDIIKFIRGDTRTSNFNRAADMVRNREIAYDDNPGREKMRLGDIVNSSPAAVTAPSESYDLLAGISSYRDFRQRWASRRQMVYVGSNGGMLHAFNAGFYDAGSRTVSTTGSNGENAHALGKEMWAYVPRVLLPHLKWQLEPNYPHSYYVDGSPRVFDAQVYNNDSTRQDGWGTFLVVGMRLGGGTETRHITIDSGNDGIGPTNTDNDTEDDVAALSSYVVMDITNPEEAPRILAELAPPGLNYSTSRPAVVPVGGPPLSSPRIWYLVFGSGPDTLDTAEKGGNQNAQLFFYDLNKIANGFTAYNDPPEVVIDLPNTEGQFVGGISVADFDLNVRAEAIYVTTAGDNNKGLVARIVMNESSAPDSWNTHVLLNSLQPMVSEPTLALDEDGNRWVYVGSGRLFVANDNSDGSVQTLYGFIEPSLSEPILSPSVPLVAANNLYDVSTVRVFTNGEVDVDGGEADINYNAFRADVAAVDGWKRDYHAPGGTSPSQRTTNPSTLLGEVLFNTAYTPPGVNSTAAGCGAAALGESVLIGVDFRTGVSHPFGVLGTTRCGLSVCADGDVEEALSEYKLGRGLSSLPSLHLGSPNESLPGRITVVTQQSTGEVESVGASTVPGAGGSTNIDWREYAN